MDTNDKRMDQLRLSWTSLLNFGMKAVGAVISQYVRSEGMSSEESCLGPIKFTNTENDTLATNMADFTVVLSISSSNNAGEITHNELTLKQGETKSLAKEINTNLGKNLTGTLSWAKFDNKGKFLKELKGDIEPGRVMVSIKDWGKKQSAQMFKRGLNVTRNDDKNCFFVQALDEEYYDIQIMIVDWYGSVYDFGPFDIEKNSTTVVEYPDELDRILPIPRVTIWARCGEEKYKEMTEPAIK